MNHDRGDYEQQLLADQGDEYELIEKMTPNQRAAKDQAAGMGTCHCSGSPPPGNRDGVMKSKIQINVDGISEIHIAYTGEGYNTLCGVDGRDEGIGHSIESESPRGKVSCAACVRIATEGRRGGRRQIRHGATLTDHGEIIAG